MAVHIRIDRSTCIGSGNCIFSAPDVFEHDDDGLASVSRTDLIDDPALHAVAMNCPSRSITIEVH